MKRLLIIFALLTLIAAKSNAKDDFFKSLSEKSIDSFVKNKEKSEFSVKDKVESLIFSKENQNIKVILKEIFRNKENRMYLKNKLDDLLEKFQVEKIDSKINAKEVLKKYYGLSKEEKKEIQALANKEVKRITRVSVDNSDNEKLREIINKLRKEYKNEEDMYEYINSEIDAVFDKFNNLEKTYGSIIKMMLI